MGINKVYCNSLYIADIQNILSSTNLNELKHKTVMVSGATGMIGSMLIDTIMKSNNDINVIALGRNKEKAKNRFDYYSDNKNFRFIECDITSKESLNQANEKTDYIIHLASTTHPIAYATEPIGTITSNVLGTINLLDYGVSHGMRKFLLASSVEIYGENRGDIDFFTEDYCGYIDSNTLRAGYPESKRVSEALCQAYLKQYGVEVCIARLARTFGPTMQSSDSKAIAQFIKKAIAGEDIILKSAGTQLYSYCYSADAVSALLTILKDGKNGEAYNISGTKDCNVQLKDLANLIANSVNSSIKFDIPDEIENQGYSKATKAVLDISKMSNSLNWHPKYNLKEAIERTIAILKSLQ